MASPWFPPPLETPEQQQHEDMTGTKPEEHDKPKFWNRALKRLSYKTSNKSEDKPKRLLASTRKKDDQARTPKSFNFLGLPAEIRNMIYEYTFTNPTDYDISPWEPPKPASHWLQALLTCRTIHQEAGLIAFSCVLFIVRFLPNYDHLRERFARLSTAQIQSIRRLGGMLFGSDHGFNCHDNGRAVWFYMRNVGLELNEILYLSYWPNIASSRSRHYGGADVGGLPDLMFYLYRFQPSVKRIAIYCDSPTGWQSVVTAQDYIGSKSGGRLKLQRRQLERCDERDLIAWDVIETDTGNHVHSCRLRRSNQYNLMGGKEIDVDEMFRDTSWSEPTY